MTDSTQIADVVPQGSFTFFAPQIVVGLGKTHQPSSLFKTKTDRAPGYESVQAQLFTVPPWAIGFCVAITLSYSADRLNARGLHIAAASTVGGIGWLCNALLPADAYVARYGCLCLAATGAFPVAPSMTNWVTCNTPSLLTIPFAIALNNSCAGFGQIIAQWIWKTNERNQGFPTGNAVCAACSFYVAASALGLRWWYARMNRLGTRDARGEKRVWSY